MGVECGDYNNDGRLDFYMTSYQNELATLYENRGGGVFDDVTRQMGRDGYVSARDLGMPHG